MFFLLSHIVCNYLCACAWCSAKTLEPCPWCAGTCECFHAADVCATTNFQHFRTHLQHIKNSIVRFFYDRWRIAHHQVCDTLAVRNAHISVPCIAKKCRQATLPHHILKHIRYQLKYFIYATLSIFVLLHSTFAHSNQRDSVEPSFRLHILFGITTVDILYHCCIFTPQME